MKFCMTGLQFLEKTFFAPKIGGNVLKIGIADCRIFNSTISPGQTDETASFFAWWYKFTKIKNWLKIFGWAWIKNGCGQAGVWTLKLIVSEIWTDGIKWFFTCWYKFMQIKRCLKIFAVGMVKNGCSQSGLVTGVYNWLYLKNEKIE